MPNKVIDDRKGRDTCSVSVLDQGQAFETESGGTVWMTTDSHKNGVVGCVQLSTGYFYEFKSDTKVYRLTVEIHVKDS